MPNGLADIFISNSLSWYQSVLPNGRKLNVS
jgi:hypothetical protein